MDAGEKKNYRKCNLLIVTPTPLLFEGSMVVTAFLWSRICRYMNVLTGPVHNVSHLPTTTNSRPIRPCPSHVVESWGQQCGTAAIMSWIVWWCWAGPWIFVSLCFRLGLRGGGWKEWQSRPQVMYCGDKDTVFVKRLSTMGTVIQRALPQNPTKIFVKKGCHRIERGNGRKCIKWDLVEPRRRYDYDMCSIRTKGFWN